MSYVVVYLGWEGISTIFWAGDDKREAIRQVRAIRKQIDAIGPAPNYYHEEAAWNTWALAIPDHLEPCYEARYVCVMCQHANSPTYRCCCKELGVAMGHETPLC